ncbi:hypothetical protein [Nocardia asteroides]|uniref:hypothetical protein n=1 Tax=Nocardia asteroides TaxID=1824 RepID=UPI0033F572DA
MNAAAKPGLGDLGSTRPLTREERRAEAARVRAEREAAEQQTAPDPAPEPAAAPLPAAAPSVTIPMKKRGIDKRPFSTQLRAETAARLAWLVEQGAVLTDTVDTAITTYLDAAGVPRPGPDGTMPNV